ncbi:MAG: hypothetical protein ABSD99_09865, partial [Candidatus Bathyarchaeia archaeon]
MCWHSSGTRRKYGQQEKYPRLLLNPNPQSSSMMIPNEKNTVLSDVPFDVTFVTSVLLSVRGSGVAGEFSC